ncbi:hypothetical protein DYBT9623_05344 [Dyadobacter sp. CECT 9623]|uniref:Lipoprotein n=1 Tax=Dyadobacter linearis TaxID=2823330 RepID=A0ABN7REV1_9BACT|nr:hypothetical protein [Dyadobacter sp. CECT 9623]CAG5074657.1 hypothetical protein DYBT9623_05344 [Dyadobacter sp. CECT 9623]
MVKSKPFRGLLRISLFMTFVTFLVAGCKEDPYVITCKDGLVEYQELMNGELVSFMNVKDADKVIQRVIRSRSELEQSLDLSRVNARIDFKEKTLLAGRIYSSQRANLIRQEVTSDCKREEITYSITLKYHQYLPESGYTKFFAIIPKISDKTKVKLIINYEN